MIKYYCTDGKSIISVTADAATVLGLLSANPAGVVVAGASTKVARINLVGTLLVCGDYSSISTWTTAIGAVLPMPTTLLQSIAANLAVIDGTLTLTGL